MHTFTNKFNIALNQDKTEVMVTFYQNYPVMADQLNLQNVPQEIPANVEAVSQLVMTAPFAKVFAENLLALMATDTQES